MSNETNKSPKAEPVVDDDSEFVPKYLSKDYKTPETFLRRAEEMKIFLALNPLPEAFLKRKPKA